MSGRETRGLLDDFEIEESRVTVGEVRQAEYETKLNLTNCNVSSILTHFLADARASDRFTSKLSDS